MALFPKSLEIKMVGLMMMRSQLIKNTLSLTFKPPFKGSLNFDNSMTQAVKAQTSISRTSAN
jgi:hypothetical protein